MLPKSVAIRQRAANDFESCYENLCSLQSSVPLYIVKVNLKNKLLDLNGDKIRMIDWSPILDSIRINKSLCCIIIRSYFQPSNGNGKKVHYFKRKTPAIRSKDVTVWIASSLQACLSINSVIKRLDLQGVPLREKDVHILAKGLEKNCSLTHVQFNYCQLADTGVKILCQSLRNHFLVTHLSLSGCNITATGTEAIATLIKHQSTLRHGEAWADSLRYRTPNLNCMGGIRRITLNSNPMIGDEGLSYLTEALKDDLWIKAFDLQNCGITTKGALHLLATMQHNKTIVVMDVRSNPMIDTATLRSLLGRVLINATEHDEADYPWVKEEIPKDPYKTRRYRPPRSANGSFGKKYNSRITQKSTSYEKLPGKVSPNQKSFMPWRTAVRANQRKLGYVDDESNEGESTVLALHHNTTVQSDQTYSTFEPDQFTLYDESHLSQKESLIYIKQLKVYLINSQRKLQAAVENEKYLNEKIMTLEVENARLQRQLTENFENSRLKSQIEDDMLFESIEQSFNKFHNFLNILHDVGLGSLADAAGLDSQLSFPLDRNMLSEKKTPRVKKTIETGESTLADKPIVIEGGPKSPEKSKDSVNTIHEATDKSLTAVDSNGQVLQHPTTNVNKGDALVHC